MPKQPQRHRFDINAAVVFRLGEELITDVVQALVELVKNSYDADATWVNVAIDTRAKNQWGRNYANAMGAILVEDNGHGMDDETIRLGWLTIANSPKKELKASGRMTLRGRTPIGDKGLGRLGSQRLADNVEIMTTFHAQRETERYISFSWKDFRETSSLGEVPVKFEQREGRNKQSGMKLVLSGLRDRELWQAEKQVLNLQRKLSGMISPFEEVRDFRVRLEVDGKKLELAEIARKVRETAPLKYTFRFDGKDLHISGVARLKYFQPRSRADAALFKSVCQNDGGSKLYEFLANKTGKGRPEQFALSKREGWFVEFGTRRTLDDMDGVRRAKKSAVSPGPFHAEVDAVSLDSSEFMNDTASRRSEFRELVRDLAGIRVYRDGFGIRVGEDWLGLGKQQTEATSYYGLRPGNVIGFVAISARDNPDLVETTSREGFQVTAHYENFYALLTEFVRFAGDTQEYLRRGVLSFLNEHRDRTAGVTPEEPHSAVTQRIHDIAGKLSEGKVRVRRRTGALTKAASGAAQKLGAVRAELDKSLFAGPPVSNALESLETQLSAVSKEVAREERLLEEISSALDQAAELKTMKEVLDRRWMTLNEQMSALYESVSLGITAEALSHEIHNIADRLAKKSSTIRRRMNGQISKSSMVGFLEEVRSSVAAMRKQLAHLTPSLRYLREEREEIDLASFVQELAEFYEDRLAQGGIRLIAPTRSETFSVKMNRGKLMQVFDNLVLNAEYWLKDALEAGVVKQGEITIAIAKPYVRVSDNGRGVDESVEDSLFEPFVTKKRIREGRGLGLFVCRQLLDSEACVIELMPDRNKRGRRYMFEFDLSGVTGE